jgi:hypothetical protein
MSMALVAAGRKAEAGEFALRSEQAGPVAETRVAAQILDYLLSDAGEPPIEVERPAPGPALDESAARRLTIGFQDVQKAVDQGAWDTGLAAMEDIPAPLRLHSGASVRFLYSYLLYKSSSGRMDEAIEELEDLAREETDYVSRHPEVYYLLGRAHDYAYNFDKALRNMRTYVEILSTQGDDDVPEPSPEDAPTTDAPGESDKDTHDEHS